MLVVFLCAWLFVRCSWLVSFISISQVIVWEGWVMFCIHQEISWVDGLQNDLYYVERDIKPTQLICLLSWCNLQLLLADCVLRMMDDRNLVIIVITALLKVKCQTKPAVILTRHNSPVVDHWLSTFYGCLLDTHAGNICSILSAWSDTANDTYGCRWVSSAADCHAG